MKYLIVMYEYSCLQLSSCWWCRVVWYWCINVPPIYTVCYNCSLLIQ